MNTPMSHTKATKETEDGLGITHSEIVGKSEDLMKPLIKKPEAKQQI